MWVVSVGCCPVAQGCKLAHMAGCPGCGHENRDGAKFCEECATALGAAAPAGPVAEERKVVSVLFCDLVGFTAISEAADPEDVARMLAAYFKVARARIEGHGGVVGKFIGDAVVGVFGVPAAHEDDPERAVRAGLRIVEDAEHLHGVGDSPVSLRVGVNTGEALVRLDVSPESAAGFLVGDPINTAARIQSVAPVNGVAVGLATYEATRVMFDYTELEPASLKGKSQPVRLFHARAARARLGTDLTRTHDSPFVGREIDLALLKGLFDKSVAAGSVQLVTVVGEPGLGKSRLVAELGGYVDSLPGLVTWRQGRCLPYGEGITFWALGEIVKAHSGILESDPPAIAREKLDAVLPEGVEREWFRQRLLPLLGIEATSSAEREELFTAWRRFLEQIAEADPTVLVFEDLHWADEGLLAFLEHLADLAEGVPLLLVGTARPELFERHPDYAARLRNSTPINLAPLTLEETARLVSGLLDATVLSVEVQQPILERCGGNPLYAEEFVRLLRDGNLLERTGPTWQLTPGAVVPFPASVQALIAARLDTLEPDAKSLLADAAVIGKVFWAGAVAAMGERDPQQVTSILRELSRKELVRPSRQSSMAGEAEYAFWHVLARDVAYKQLPRASRANRHVAAASWIESRVPDRVEDLADVLAYHYTAALDLATAAGHGDRAAQLQAPTLRFLILAGERALGLDTAAALASFERALALTPEGHPQRAAALARFGEAALHAGRYNDARDALEQAITAFQAMGDRRGTARTMGTLGNTLYRLGDPRGWELPAEAVALLEPLPPGPEHVAALSELARAEALQERQEAAIGYAEQAIALAARLGLPAPARAQGYRGAARCQLGDRGGLDDFREAIVLATEAGQGREVALLHNNYSLALLPLEGPRASLDVLQAGIAFAQVRGLTESTDMLTTGVLSALVETGEYEQALTLAADLATDLEASGYLWGLGVVRAEQARILTLRGQANRVADTLDWLETTMRGTGQPDLVVSGLGAAALARAALAQPDHATALLSEIATAPGSRDNVIYLTLLPALVRTALTIDNPQLAHQLTTGVQPRTSYAEHALATTAAALAEANGNHQTAAAGYEDAAARWHAFGVITEQAFALLGHGRCLHVLGDPAATRPLRQARDLFSQFGAAPHIADCDTLLAQAAQHAS
jgi:class 3 adenylate cyclase/tetratricopeptide (TPR) repeat protein